jgi:hypothetical protein
MAGQIHIDATELGKMSGDTNRQMENVRDLTTAIDRAVGGTDWRSKAFSNFQEGWAQDNQILKQLQGNLQEWSQFCKSQVDPANRVNQPFRR